MGFDKMKKYWLF